MEAIMNEKAMTGISRFLGRRDMNIVESGWAHGKNKIDFVVEDGGELVFVACQIRENGSVANVGVRGHRPRIATGIS